MALTGARDGDVLVGVKEDSQNVMLRVCGVISLSERHVNFLDDEIIIKALAKKYGESMDRARIRFADLPRGAKRNDDKDENNALPLGNACGHRVPDACDDACTCEGTFQILQPGIWESFAADAGEEEALMQYVEDKTFVTWRDVLRLVGKKTLILRKSLYIVDHGPQVASEAELQEASLIDTMPLMKHEAGISSVFKIDKEFVRLPQSADGIPSSADIIQLVMQAVHGLDGNEVQLAFNSLKKLTSGALKSALQKCIRFCARRVFCTDSMSGEEAGSISSSVYAAVACAMLFADKGTFSPELQLFTFGRTAALKRMAVILVEDVWVHQPDTESKIEALLGMALATQRMPNYYPPTPAILATIQLAYEAAQSKYIVNWRSVIPPKAPTISTLAVPQSNMSKSHMQNCARLLRIVRSFEGDMRMMEATARLSSQGSLPLIVWNARDQQDLVSDVHIWDQHVSRGIAHLLGASFGDTFSSRFSRLFKEVTGYNPRFMDSPAGFEGKLVVQQARFAQRLTMRFALSVPLTTLSQQGQDRVHFPLDSGVLAAGIGPVQVQVLKTGTKKTMRTLLVTLGIETPEDEIVMQPPSRNSNDLYDGISETEKQLAVQACRNLTLHVKSPLLPAGTARFADGKWRFNGVDWESFVVQGVQHTVDVHPAPAWALRDELSTILRDNEAFQTALSHQGSGVVENAELHVRRLVSVIPTHIVLRARSMLRQQYEQIKMPCPALDGGMATDQLMAYPGDSDAFRLLVLISRLCPGALRCTQATRFSVPDAILLRILDLWMIPVLGDEGIGANQWTSHELWSQVVRVSEEKLRHHQKDAIERMLHRDEARAVPAHFIVMDTGLGKTLTALCYFAHRFAHSALGSTVKRMLWVTPPETIDSLVRQLSVRKLVNVPVHVVPAPKTGKNASTSVHLMDYCVNVINSNYMRTAIMLNLPDLASSSAVVFDEVDTMYDATQRTSACRRLAHLCAAFIAQTATPMTRNVAHLASWLADTEPFPVTPANFLVAASGMVATRVNLGIQRKDVLHEVPLTQAVRDAQEQYRLDRQWMELAATTQRQTDAEMCRSAAEFVRHDTKTHPTGGALLVANDKSHAAELIAQMNALGVRTAGFEQLIDTKYNCIVVTKSQDRGYNGAARFGGIVKGVYAGNGSSRHQMRGRVCRIGQVRSEVVYVTVVMKNSMLQLLHERQQNADTVNISLEAIAKIFDAEVLGMGE